MPTLDEFFGVTKEPVHPRLRDWKRRLEAPNSKASLEIYRPKGELGQGRPEMYVQFYEGGKETHLDTVPWDDDLNTGLIHLKVRAVSPQQEAERIALGLRAALRGTQREFGDGYFNAVLVELVKESDLTRHREIADVMKYAYANTPHREGGAFDRYTICREKMADAISGRARELTDEDKLGYSQEDAKKMALRGFVWVNSHP